MRRIYMLLLLGAVVISSCKGPEYYTFSRKNYDKICKKGKTNAYLDRHKTLNPEYFVHVGDSVIQLENVLVDRYGESLVTGESIEMAANYERTYKYMKKQASYKNFHLEDDMYRTSVQSHLFVEDASLLDPKTIKITNEQITGYVLYQGHPHVVDKKKTGLAVGLGVGLPVAGLATFIAIACSCPHVYVSDGRELRYSNTMFTGAVSANMERYDVKKLPNFNGSDEVSMRIKNEDKEIQHINVSELQVVQHEKGTGLVNDQEGNFYTVSNPLEPVYVQSVGTMEDVNTLATTDGKYYAFDGELANNLSSLDVEFDLTERVSEDGRLLLSARNSDWAGVVYKSFINLFGNKMDEYREKNAAKSKEERDAEFEKHGIPMIVEVQYNGEWEKVEVIDLVGATNFTNLAVNIPSKYLAGTFVKVRLSTAYKFWDLDYIAFDASEQKPYKLTTISPTVENGSSALTSDDNDYIILNSGDEVDLKFTGLPIGEETERTLFIRSKGYYVSTESSDEKMQKSTLMKLNKPGGLSLFSKSLHDSYMKSVSENK